MVPVFVFVITIIGRNIVDGSRIIWWHGDIPTIVLTFLRANIYLGISNSLMETVFQHFRFLHCEASAFRHKSALSVYIPFPLFCRRVQFRLLGWLFVVVIFAR
jgi:hypothetical protein